MTRATLDRPTPATDGVETMRAIVQEEYGTRPEDVLRLAQVARPAIGDGEVLLRVHAASIDRGTWHLMSGLPYPMRAAGFGIRRPKALNPGRSVAGTVEAVGNDVSELEVGDEVYGTCTGAFAEYAGARAERLARMPVSLSFDQAAAVPVSAMTALQAVRDQAKVQAGQRVLIIGASGGVGTFAVQIAKAFGAEVTGVCSTAKVDLVRSIGADTVLDYTRDDVTGSDVRYDAILDIGGNRRLSELRRVLSPSGRLVIVGGETGGRWLGGYDRGFRAQLWSAFVGHKMGGFMASENSADLIALRELVDSGSVVPAVDRTYALGEVPAAVRHLQEGRARGKVVVTV